MIPLYWFLILSAILFCLGLYAVITRRNTVTILMGIELMLNAANINLLAFWRYLYADGANLDGVIFTLIVFAAAAAEVAVGLGLILSAYRRRETIIANDLDTLKG
jgi:NADH-quinone oxidoreductase subunit K